MTSHIVFVTGNKNKQKEISDIIFSKMVADKKPHNFKLHFINFPYMEEIQSVNTNKVSENKVQKAAECLKKETEFLKTLEPYKNIFILVDDTGLYAKTSPVNKITYTGKGYPGALIKDFVKSIEGNCCDGICNSFGGSMACTEVSIGIFNITTCIWDVVTELDYGHIPIEPKYDTTNKSFGWDPCFIPNTIGDKKNEKHLSYDMLPSDIKNKYSMRSKAISSAYDKICSHL